MLPSGKQRTRRKSKCTLNQEREVWSQQQRKRRRELGQNFLKDDRIASEIVREARVTDRDLVVEPGAGAGMLTRSLSRAARKVVAVEYDPVWATRLRQSFSAGGNVEVVAGDALSVDLPDEPFRVVANVPFQISTAILHRLLDDPTRPPELVHLLLQKEVARKHGRATPTTLKTLSWGPWWLFDAGFELPASAFDPRPEVDACLLAAVKRDVPLVSPEHRELFRAFVRVAFNGHGNIVGKWLRPVFTRKQIRRLALDNGFSTDSVPSRLTVHQWANIFKFMVRAVPKSRWPIPESTADHNIGWVGRR